MATEDDTSRETLSPEAPSDFRRLRESGEAAGASRAIGRVVGAARDALARALVRLGATPNRLTVMGFLATCGAGCCLARGAAEQVPYFYSGSGPVGWWPFYAAACLVLAGACDMLDGAVARVGKMKTSFGGILDSALDRLSDMAVFVGCGLHFAWHGNFTYQLLAVLALCAALLISYVKARAEDTIPDCSVGWWLRGERSVAILLACLTGHVPFVLWQQATLPLLTVWRRLTYARQVAAALDAGRPLPPGGPSPGWRRALQPWRHPRGSLPFDLVAGFHIACIIVWPRLWPALLAIGNGADPLARWFGR